MLLYGGAFTVLLLLISGASAVPPPTNVNVTCRNTNVTVSWDYSKDHPQTEFLVNITSPSNEKVWKTKDHQHDLSEFVWESDKNFMSQMSVSVTAIQGGNMSPAGISQMFTFNNLMTARLKCQLDFPPVDLDLKDSGATLTFKNPVHYSKELRKLNDDEMTFSVTTAGKQVKSNCPRDMEVCRLDFSYPDGVKDKCVNLTGLLWVVSPINFTKIDHICPSSIEPYQIALIMVLICAGLIVTVVTIIICVTKAWTLKNASLPEFLEDFDENRRRQIATVCRTSTSSVTVYRPCKNPSVSSEDDGAGSDDSADDSIKTECVSLYVVVDEEEEQEQEQEEEERERVYDRPHIVQVDMGDRDMATGYTARKISL